MSTDPNFIQKLEEQAETFFEHMKEQLHEATHDAAPSSTEPVAAAEQPAGEQGNAGTPEVASTDATTSATGPAVESTSTDTATVSSSAEAPYAPVVAEESATAPAISDEAPNVDAPTAPAGDATPAAGEDPNATVSVAVELPVESSPSATSAPSDAGESQTAANTPAESQTFEQMVEARFLKLEAAVMQLPASMHAVMSDGSKEPEDFAKAVMAHVFAHI